MAVENSKVLKAAQKERIGPGRDGRVMEHAERGSRKGASFVVIMRLLRWAAFSSSDLILAPYIESTIHGIFRLCLTGSPLHTSLAQINPLG
jgi:hypothetical protein